MVADFYLSKEMDQRKKKNPMAVPSSINVHHILATFYHFAIVIGLLTATQANARTVKVGGVAGWTNFDPATGKVPDYASWANSASLSFDDTLEFVFETGGHNLYELVSQAALDACNFTGSMLIFGFKTASPTKVTLKAAGIHYFACTGNTTSGLTHCQQGQKFSVSMQRSLLAVNRISAPTNSPPPASSAPLIAGIVVALIVVFAAGIAVYCCRQRMRASSLRKRMTHSDIKEVMSSIEQGKGSLQVFTVKELERASENFAEHLTLGIGGFGTVYKGTLKNGMVHVAIKVSNHASTSGKKQLLNEVSILSQTSHRNLVKLFGCCLQTQVPILVYEYIPNGNLYEHLHRLRFGVNLNWSKRLQIATETAEALAYLHFSALPPIYHRDVKTSNILLDNTFTVKVADFGISRLTNPEKSHVSTAVQGTPGYLDPEYFHSYHLTEKSDVYSFGVVLLELITSQKALDYKREAEYHSLAAYAMPYIRKGKVFLEKIVDPQLKEPADKFKETLQAIHCVAELAVACLADKRKDRPSMRAVVEDLYSIKGFNKRSGPVGAGPSLAI